MPTTTMNSAAPQEVPARAQVQACRYKTGKTLGAGSYSVVKECVHIDTGRYYAAKVINKRLMAGREHMVRNEIAVLKRISLGHQNILTLVDYFETMNNLYLVTDLALGGELFDRICRKGSYFESDAASLIRSTLSAVAYLHDHGIVHRDLKPENLLFRTPEDNADLLIADFGLSRIMDEEQFHVLTTTCGTPGYMAPEIFKKTGHGKPVDVWAIGVITYFLLCGYTPFDRDSNLEEMQAILVADYSFTPVEYWRGVSQSARDFINRCLTIDPQKRMTAHEALQHPFVAGEVVERETAGGEGKDLLPTVKKNFNARRTLHAAIDTVRAINKLREGQNVAAIAKAGGLTPHKASNRNNASSDSGVGMEGVEMTGRGAEPGSTPTTGREGISVTLPDFSRQSGQGQTDAQIEAQKRRIAETTKGLWSGAAVSVLGSAPTAQNDDASTAPTAPTTEQDALLQPRPRLPTQTNTDENMRMWDDAEVDGTTNEMQGVQLSSQALRGQHHLKDRERAEESERRSREREVKLRSLKEVTEREDEERARRREREQEASRGRYDWAGANGLE